MHPPDQPSNHLSGPKIHNLHHHFYRSCHVTLNMYIMNLTTTDSCHVADILDVKARYVYGTTSSNLENAKLTNHHAQKMRTGFV